MIEISQNEHLDALLVYVRVVSLPWIFPRQSQLGLYYLAQQASEKGFKVLVDNLSSNDHIGQRINRLLNEHSCRLVGFYVDQDNMWTLRRVLPPLKRSIPDLSIILGGPQVTADAESVLSFIPEATCGVIGEGEATFVELLALPSLCLENLEKCKGLALNDNGTIRRTPPREPIDPLDCLSIPERKKLSTDPNNELPTMITGRGCIGQCAFCYESKHGKRLRFHSVQRSLKEFDYLVQEFEKSYITILDDSFVTNVSRLREFCMQLISKYEGKVKWFCESRVDILDKNPDLLPLMIEAGLIRLQVGGESGNQHILDLYGKGTTLQQMISVVESAKKNGLLSLYANFIIGGAKETRATYQDTLNFALKLLDLAPGCMEIGSSFYTPYPGTRMYKDPEAFGIEVIDKNVVTGAGDQHVFVRTKELSRFDILDINVDFKSKIERKMIELSKQLPKEVIYKHFQAFDKWALITDWYKIFRNENANVYSYFKSISVGSCKRFEEIARKELSEAYPCRTTELVTSKDERYIVRIFDGSLCILDPLESTILELSAGKLSFDEIITIIGDRVPEISLNKIREACIVRYEKFERECLVVWRIGD